MTGFEISSANSPKPDPKIKPKSTFDWKESKYNYDYKDFTYFKVIKESDNVYKILEDGKIRDLNYEYYIKNYNENSKCVIKNMLFIDKKMKSVKTTKLVDEVINVIKEV